MNILTISNYFPSHPGGIEFVAMNLVLRWRKNHQVRWAACDVATHPHNSDTDDLPLPANNFTERWLGFPYPIPSLSSIPIIFKQAKWSDIVHIHDCIYFTSVVAFFASLVYSKPIVITQHVGLVPYKEKSKKILQMLAYQTIGRLILERSSEIVFINENVKDWFTARLRTRRISLIPNGVNRQIFYPPKDGEREMIRAQLGYSEEDVIFLFIGRFTQKKGIHLIKEIALNRPNYHWIMIGHGDVDVLKWNLPNIKIFPPQAQVKLRDFYLAANLFVLPSAGEGFPLAVQEALSCGLPTAVSEEVAISLSEAPLIRLNISSSQQIVKTLDGIMSDLGTRIILQSKSNEFAEQWNWDVTAHKYEELLINIADKYSKPSK